MKLRMNLLMGIFFLLAGGCFKSSNGSQDPALNSPSPIPDGLSFPVTKNSYWEYQRIDSFAVTYNYNGAKYISADTSKELVTLIGDTLLNIIDPNKRLLVLQIKNLTHNTMDTTYIYYSTSRFYLYTTHLIKENDNFFNSRSVSPPFTL